MFATTNPDRVTVNHNQTMIQPAMPVTGNHNQTVIQTGIQIAPGEQLQHNQTLVRPAR